MENFTSVRPEHLNQHGFLFGGQMLLWVDEFAWMAATLDYPGCKFVTVGIDKANFHRSAPLGASLRFNIEPTRRGNTSVTYGVRIFARPFGAAEEYPIFSTGVTFVRVDESGNKIPLPVGRTRDEG